MDRRQALQRMVAASAGLSLLKAGRAPAQELKPPHAPDASSLYLHPEKGSDTNSGTKDNPLKTLTAAARRVNESTGSAAMTIILAEGVYAVNEPALLGQREKS